MASSSITVVTKADANVVFTLVGNTSQGASYKDVTRDLSVPRTLDFQYFIGNPGALGNDRMVITFRDSRLDTALGKVVTAQVKVEASVPRAAAITSTVVEDLLAHVCSLLTDARCENVADAVVP